MECCQVKAVLAMAKLLLLHLNHPSHPQPQKIYKKAILMVYETDKGDTKSEKSHCPLLDHLPVIS